VIEQQRAGGRGDQNFLLLWGLHACGCLERDGWEIFEDLRFRRSKCQSEVGKIGDGWVR
jgi:hypothetical protein